MARRPSTAAAIIKRALEKKNHRDHSDLKKELAKHNLSGYYLAKGLRRLRDAYGENCVVKTREGKQILYVLDPDAVTAKVDFNERARRSLTEAEHLMQDIDWVASNFGNTGFTRRAGRYAKNLVAELQELVSATTNGA